MPYKNGNPPLFSTWWDMIQRCTNPNRKTYKHYGGRGIKVCPQWAKSREQFCTDMGPRPPGMTLERIDNNGDYTPENCRWATRRDQSRNQRVTRKVTIKGKEYIAADLAELSGQLTVTIVARAKAGLTYKEVIDKNKYFDPKGLKQGAGAAAAKRKSKTHCKRGHEYTPENTIINKDGKYTFRVCRACNRLWKEGKL